MLSRIYTESLNLLREIDKNRNETINFYVLAIAAYLAASNFNGENFVQLWFFVSILLSIYGFIQAFNLVEHRIWHTRYSYTARLIAALMVEDDNPKKIKPKIYQSIVESVRKQIIKEDLLEKDVPSRDIPSREAICKDKENYFPIYLTGKYRMGTECLTYNAFLVLNFIPIANILRRILAEQADSTLGFLVALIILLIYMFIMNVIAARSLFNDYFKNEELPFPIATWLLHGVKSTQV